MTRTSTLLSASVTAAGVVTSSLSAMTKATALLLIGAGAGLLLARWYLRGGRS